MLFHVSFGESHSACYNYIIKDKIMLYFTVAFLTTTLIFHIILSTNSVVKEAHITALLVTQSDPRTI